MNSHQNAARPFLWWAVTVSLGVITTGCLPTRAPIDPVPDVRFSDGKSFMLYTDLHYRIGSTAEVIVVPAGFVHDGASIPSVVTPLIPKDGWYTYPAIVHDYLYWTQLCSRKQADNIMLLAMKEQGNKTSKKDRFAIHKALRAVGEIAWNNNEKERNMGLPRIIPARHRNIPANLTWNEYRLQLFKDGVRDPSPPSPNPSYCKAGNSTEFPDP